jgi:hypothetical protein
MVALAALINAAVEEGTLEAMGNRISSARGY